MQSFQKLCAREFKFVAQFDKEFLNCPNNSIYISICFETITKKLILDVPNFKFSYFPDDTRAYSSVFYPNVKVAERDKYAVKIRS